MILTLDAKRRLTLLRVSYLLSRAIIFSGVQPEEDAVFSVA